MTTRLSVLTAGRMTDAARSSAGSFVGRAAAVVATLSTLSLITACQTSGNNRESAGGSTATTTTQAPASTGRTTDTAGGSITRLEDLDERYGIGPLTAQKINYHVDWRVDTVSPGARLLTAQNDSVYVLDTSNFLTRYRATDGARMWRGPVASNIEEILAITDIPEAERVYVTTGGALLELDRSTGGQVGRQRFEKIPNTAPVVVGQFLVYGARNGQVIWHSYPVEFQWKASQLAQSINVQPALGEGYIAAVGNDGEMMLLDADQGRMIWTKKLLDEAVSTPVIGGGVVYVSSLDQHVRAYEARTGRLLWKVLTTAPLTMAPVLLDNNVYQPVPGEGLVCYDALPIDSPGGKELWRADQVSGGVITRHGRDLITWDSGARVMHVIDATYGSLKNTFKMPTVHRLYTTDLQDGVMYLLTDGGTLSRVAPAP